MKFRKKPVVIDAWLVEDLLELYPILGELPKEILDAVSNDELDFGTNFIRVLTLEGSIFATTDDVLIMGIQGEFYPCKKNIFSATYEKVEN